MYGGVTRSESNVGIVDIHLEELLAKQKCSVTEVIDIMSHTEFSKIYNEICKYEKDS